jgi:Tfp pilus assembly pilus retraction ATPase PilT
MNAILQRAAERNDSDILITAGCPPVMRIDGELEPQHDYPILDTFGCRKAFFEILSENRRKELKETLELDFSSLREHVRTGPQMKRNIPGGKENRLSPIGGLEHGGGL